MIQYIHIPQDPFATSLIWLTAIVGVYGMWKKEKLGLILLISLVSARVLDVNDWTAHQGFILLFCGALCLTSVRDNKIVQSRIETHELCYAMAALYGIRALIRFIELYIMGAGQFTSKVVTEGFWIIGIGLLILQIALVLGGSADGSRRHINRRIAGYRHHITDVFRDARNKHFNAN